MTNTDNTVWTRSDGDSWDIVTSVGYTALGVAAARAVASATADSLVHDEFAEHFVRASGAPSLTALVDGAHQPDQPLFIQHIGLRSRFFDEFFVDATRSGCTQAVILAAGLDARAYRLSWPPGVTVFELDQPRVLEFKAGVLDEQRARSTTDRIEVAVDLRDDWPVALREQGFDPCLPTAWSAEGLLPYLPGTAQDLLFERVSALSAPGSRIAVEEMADIAKISELSKKYIDSDSPIGKVDLGSLIYDDERPDLVEWFAARGWRTDGADPFELAERYATPLTDLPDELLEVNRKMRYLVATLPG